MGGNYAETELTFHIVSHPRHRRHALGNLWREQGRFRSTRALHIIENNPRK